jgi:hypothetical protein
VLQGDFADYIKQLDANPDLNAPNDEGQLALIEAVKSRKANFVEMALEYGATATVPVPASGKTGLHYAYANQDVPVRPRRTCSSCASVDKCTKACDSCGVDMYIKKRHRRLCLKTCLLKQCDGVTDTLK